MSKLKKVVIHKYKSFNSDQEFEVDDLVTVLVGMNESGKTSILEAIAKVNYFEKDNDFEFSLTHDYPRVEKKGVDRSKEDPAAVTLTYELDPVTIKKIEDIIGKGSIGKEISYVARYSGNRTFTNYQISTKEFYSIYLKKLGISPGIYDWSKISKKKFTDIEADLTAAGLTAANIALLEPYMRNSWEWNDSIEEYIFRVIIDPSLPKALYYDEYYSLPSYVNLEATKSTGDLTSEVKTAKALLELADLNIEAITAVTDEDSFEEYKAELEATQAEISEELFKYWKTNTNLGIEFDIRHEIVQPASYHSSEVKNHILHIRVKNTRARVSLPLQNRSKGFNWFFSFLVWFKKIQASNTNNYILLLDEPGLNLHALAQKDLLDFINDLAAEKGYQVIFTTHSPFMVETRYLPRVRTVFESDKGAVISDSVSEKDGKTIFPLQAALGYDIAQSLFVSERNLVVEGISDLVYIDYMSQALKSKNKEGLKSGVSIVPVGGADKVVSFVSLFKGQDLKSVLLLDTFKDQSARQRLESLIARKIIEDKKVLFADKFCRTGINPADIEDIFKVEDYLEIFNNAFPECIIAIGDINTSKPIMSQLEAHLKNNGKKGFNHYLPSRALLGMDTFEPSEESLNAFELVFKTVNKFF